MKGAPSLRYVARQPIFDRDEKGFGYELLFRCGIGNYFGWRYGRGPSIDPGQFIASWARRLVCGRHAFVNCMRDTLIKGLVTLLPPNLTIVEILERVPADPDVLTACQKLKEQGYTIAVDDYASDDPREALARIADIIKVEMQLTTEKQRSELIKQFASRHCRMLTEKIETHAEFVRARDQGFVYFQGYFFRRPEMLSTRDMPAHRLHDLRSCRKYLARNSTSPNWKI